MIKRLVQLGCDSRIHTAEIVTIPDVEPLDFRYVAYTTCGLSNRESHGPINAVSQTGRDCQVCKRGSA